MPLHQHVLATRGLLPSLRLVAHAVCVLFVLDLIAITIVVLVLQLIFIWRIISMKFITHYVRAFHCLEVMVLPAQVTLLL